MGCCFLPQGLFLTQGSNLGLLHCRRNLDQLSQQGSPWASSYHAHSLLTWIAQTKSLHQVVTIYLALTTYKPFTWKSLHISSRELDIIIFGPLNRQGSEVLEISSNLKITEALSKMLKPRVCLSEPKCSGTTFCWFSQYLRLNSKDSPT